MLLKDQTQVQYDSLLERMMHRIIHPVGQLFRALSPNAYASARWKLGRLRPTQNFFGNPMSQHFLVPLLVRKGDTVLDIGANTGQFTIPLAHLVGPNGIVHSFEPISTTFNELKQAIKGDGVSAGVRLCQFALGESTRTVNFTIPKDRPTEATAVPHESERWADFRQGSESYVTETCRVIKLDDYVRENDIGDISFMKCDVEGGEFQVMKGATALLTRPSPPVLMMEIFEGWTKSFGYEPRDIIRFLEKEAGYECYWISPTGLKRVKSADAVIPGVFYAWVDFLFIVPNAHSGQINIARYLSE